MQPNQTIALQNSGFMQPQNSMAGTASAALAAQSQAAVQARYIVAMHNPRKMPDVRQAMLKECRRTSFAEKAKYFKPIGKGVEGPSIRFAEMAIDAMSNMLVETPSVYDDDQKRVIRVTVMDLEKNNTYSRDVTINKTVERKQVQKGQTVISQRVNSKGEWTYTIAATDDDLLNKELALVSKAIRSCALRLIPGDLIEECMQTADEVVKQKIKQDPDEERKRIADGFSRLNINPSRLEDFLNCSLTEATPVQLAQLRALYAALKDGELTPGEVFQQSENTDEKQKNKLERTLQKKAAEIKKKEAAATQDQNGTASPPADNNSKETNAPSSLNGQNEAFDGDPSRPTPEELEEQATEAARLAAEEQKPQQGTLLGKKRK